MTEDQEATLGNYKYHLEYYREAIAKVDNLIPDFLVRPRDKDGELAKMYRNMSSAELFSLANAMQEMAEQRLYLERREREMKQENLPLEAI